MLVTDLELRHAKDRFSHFSQAVKQMRQDKFDPARYRLRMKLPHASSFLNSDESLVATLDMLESTWKRLAKLEVDFEHPKLQPFEHEFKVHQNDVIRIIFWKRREPTQPIGSLVLSLTALSMAAEERLLLRVQGFPPSNNIAEVSVGWITPEFENLVLYVQICVNRKTGWPFSRARMYYVLYTWENEGSTTWKPIYRSEIITMLAFDPLSKRPIKYAGAMVRMDGKKTDENQTRPYRLEFFHYKPTSHDHKLLSCSVFKLQELRQKLVPNGRLHMKVNNFPPTELVGALRLLESTLEYGKSTFRLEATFGGDVLEHIIYIDMETRNTCHTPVSRISFSISVYADSGTWEQYYWSEPSPNLAPGDFHTFAVAKLSEKKLMAGANNRRCLSFTFFQGHGRQRRELGATNIILSELANGTVLSLTNESGLLRVHSMDRAVNGSPRAHLSLCFEYGAKLSTPQRSMVDDALRIRSVSREEDELPTGRGSLHSDIIGSDYSPSNSDSS